MGVLGSGRVVRTSWQWLETPRPWQGSRPRRCEGRAAGGAAGYNVRMKLIALSRARAGVIAAALGALGALAGCGAPPRRTAAPAAQPDERPPLPPASGSPIGLLVEDAAELVLSNDQLGKLREIDDGLGVKLAAYDGALRTPDPARPEDPDKPRGLGFRAGGATLGPDRKAGGAMENFPGARGGGAAPDQRAGYISADTITDINYKRFHDTRDAIRRAFAVLDAAQQDIARRVLTEHGFDPDTGQETGGATGGAPAATQPAPQ
jgi:hypothetical protein